METTLSIYPHLNKALNLFRIKCLFVMDTVDCLPSLCDVHAHAHMHAKGQSPIRANDFHAHVCAFCSQELFGYKTHVCRRVLCILGYFLSLGFPLLLFYWQPEWEVWAKCSTTSLGDADVILFRTTVRCLPC